MSKKSGKKGARKVATMDLLYSENGRQIMCTWHRTTKSLDRVIQLVCAELGAPDSAEEVITQVNGGTR